jgi:leucyl aminopeptidase (aminopeptidase T)
MPIEEGADRIVGQCLAVRKGEYMLVIADIDRKVVGEAMFQAARRVEAVPILTILPPRERPSQEPPDPLAKLMLECDAIVIATGTSMTHTIARVRATKAGARVASLPGVTEETLSEGGITADYGEIGRILRILEMKLRNARRVHITSGSGTDATFSVKGREWITRDTGLATRRGEVTTLPAGEVFVAPVEETANGRLVFDVRLHDLVEQPATLMLKEGYATRIVGAKSAVAEMNKGGKEGRNLGKFGMGLNPRAKPRAHIVEAQKAMGAVHVVFGGSTPFGGKVDCDVRVDGIMTDVTVEIDGTLLMERGKLLV